MFFSVLEDVMSNQEIFSSVNGTESALLAAPALTSAKKRGIALLGRRQEPEHGLQVLCVVLWHSNLFQLLRRRRRRRRRSIWIVKTGPLNRHRREIVLDVQLSTVVRGCGVESSLPGDAKTPILPCSGMNLSLGRTGKDAA